MPLVDAQERARGPELIGGDHERRFSDFGTSMFIPYEILLQASIQKCCISNNPLPRRPRKSLRAVYPRWRSPHRLRCGPATIDRSVLVGRLAAAIGIPHIT